MGRSDVVSGGVVGTGLDELRLFRWERIVLPVIPVGAFGIGVLWVPLYVSRAVLFLW